MKSKKAFIKLNGEVGEKELPCIEYVDKSYLEKMEKHRKKLNRLLLKSSLRDPKHFSKNGHKSDV